jgi:hypothetical protein
MKKADTRVDDSQYAAPLATASKVCGAIHTETGARCKLQVGHSVNHRGLFDHGIAQWPHEDKR